MSVITRFWIFEMKLFFFYVNEELAKSICEDLELEIPKEWGDFVSLWYGSTLFKLSEGWQVLPDSTAERQNAFKKDVLHILENFEN